MQEIKSWRYTDKETRIGYTIKKLIMDGYHIDAIIPTHYGASGAVLIEAEILVSKVVKEKKKQDLKYPEEIECIEDMGAWASKGDKFKFNTEKGGYWSEFKGGFSYDVYVKCKQYFKEI